MRILISTPWFSPAFRAGGPVQSVLNMINECHDDILYSVFTADKDINNIPLHNIVRDTWTDFNDHTRVYYFSGSGTGKLQQAWQLIRRQRHDIIFIVGIYSFVFTILPLLFSRSSRIVVSVRGMLHPPALRQKGFKKKVYLKLLKPILLKRNVLFHATDDAEKKHIRSVMGQRAKVIMIPNIPKMLEQSGKEKQVSKLRLLTVALIGPMKNHLQVLKALAQSKGDIQYDICGPVFVEDYWKECQQMINKMPSNVKVIYHGPVEPRAVDRYVKEAHVFICPSQSENFGHALFEALSAGRPVITSHNTPWNGLEDAKAGINIVPDAVLISSAIEKFCRMDNTEYQFWSDGAARYARKALAVEDIRRQYKLLFAHNSPAFA